MNALTQDASNRALRAFLIALFVAVFIDVWPIVNDSLSGSDPIDVGELGKATLRLSLQAAGSFVLRRFVDPSGIPTPLPPTPQPAPAVEDPAP